MSVGWYTDHHPPKEQTPQFCLWEFPPFPTCDWNFSRAGDFTLWGMALKTESSGVGKAFHAETGNPS